jgi:hypothetical protein
LVIPTIPSAAGYHFTVLGVGCGKSGRRTELGRVSDLPQGFVTFAYMILRLPVIGALLGHKHAATTARYAHLAPCPTAHCERCFRVKNRRSNGTGLSQLKTSRPNSSAPKHIEKPDLVVSPGP